MLHVLHSGILGRVQLSDVIAEYLHGHERIRERRVQTENENRDDVLVPWGTCGSEKESLRQDLRGLGSWGDVRRWHGLVEREHLAVQVLVAGRAGDGVLCDGPGVLELGPTVPRIRALRVGTGEAVHGLGRGDLLLEVVGGRRRGGGHRGGRGHARVGGPGPGGREGGAGRAGGAGGAAGPRGPQDGVVAETVADGLLDGALARRGAGEVAGRSRRGGRRRRARRHIWGLLGGGCVAENDDCRGCRLETPNTGLKIHALPHVKGKSF